MNKFLMKTSETISYLIFRCNREMHLANKILYFVPVCDSHGIVSFYENIPDWNQN